MEQKDARAALVQTLIVGAAVAAGTEADVANTAAYDRQVHENQTVVGAGVSAAGDLAVRAGVGGSADLNVTGSALAAGSKVDLAATNNVSILSATEKHLVACEH